MYSKINKIKYGPEKPPSRIESNSPYSTNDFYYTESSRMSNNSVSPVPETIKPKIPSQENIIMKKNQDLPPRKSAR